METVTAQPSANVDVGNPSLETQGLENVQPVNEWSEIQSKIQFPKEWKKVDSEHIEMPVNGKRKVVHVNDIPRILSIGYGGYDMLNEGKKAYKEATSFIETLRQNPREVFKILKEQGHDPYAIIEQELKDQLEEQGLDENQKAIRKMQRERDEYKKMLEEKDEYINKQKFDNDVAKERESFINELPEVLDRLGVPNSPTAKAYYASRIADVMLMAEQNGIQMSMDEAAHRVIDIEENTLAKKLELLGDYDGEKLLSVMPKKTIEAVRKALLQTAKSNFTPSETAKKAISNSKENTNKQQKKQSISEYFASLTQQE